MSESLEKTNHHLEGITPNSKANNVVQEGGLILGFGSVETISNITTGLKNLSKIKRRFLYKLLLDWTQQKTLGFFGSRGRIKNAVKRIEAFEAFIEEIYKHEIGREDNFIDIKTFNAYKFNKQAIIIMSLAYILVKTSSIGDKNISEFAIELERLMTPSDFKKPPTKDKETLEYKNEKRRKRQTDTYAINLVKKYVCTPNKKYDNIVEVAQDLWQQILDKEVKVTEAEAERKRTEKALEDRRKKAQDIINSISKDLPGLTETRTKDALEKTKIRTALQEIVNRYYKIQSDTDNIAFDIKNFNEKQAGMEIKDINIRKKQIIDTIFKILREARELLDYLSSASLQVTSDNSKKEISNTLGVLIQSGGSNTPANVNDIIESLKTKINTNVIAKLKAMVTELNRTSAESVDEIINKAVEAIKHKEIVKVAAPPGTTPKSFTDVDSFLDLLKKIKESGVMSLITIGDNSPVIINSANAKQIYKSKDSDGEEGEVGGEGEIVCDENLIETILKNNKQKNLFETLQNYLKLNFNDICSDDNAEIKEKVKQKNFLKPILLKLGYKEINIDEAFNQIEQEEEQEQEQEQEQEEEQEQEQEQEEEEEEEEGGAVPSSGAPQPPPPPPASSGVPAS